MNKQELIGVYKRISNFCETVSVDKVIKELEQLYEPQKVTVPQFVADYIEESRLKGWDLLASMCFVLNAKNKKTTKWFYLGENKNIFARAWMDGFEIEKEKRYTVVMKATKQPLYYNNVEKKLFFCSMGGLATNFTQKQLEQAGFGWVFDCEGVKVEEVEDGRN